MIISHFAQNIRKQVAENSKVKENKSTIYQVIFCPIYPHYSIKSPRIIQMTNEHMILKESKYAS